MSATKQRDWLDYAGLASEFYQNVQLNDVRDKVAAMGQIALAREAREQDARIAEEKLQNAREGLFRYCSVLSKLKKQGDEDVRASHLFALKMKRVVRQSGLTTSRFPDFDDKERVSRLYDDLDDYIAQTAGRLCDDDREVVQRVESYRREMPELDALIKSKAGIEAEAEHREMQRKRYEELKDARPDNSAATLASIFGIFGIVLMLISFAFWTNDATHAGTAQSLTFFWFGVAMLVGCIFGILAQHTPEAKQRRALYAERQQLAAILEPEKSDHVVAGNRSDYQSSRLVAFHEGQFIAKGFYIRGTETHGAIREFFIRYARLYGGDPTVLQRAPCDKLAELIYQWLERTGSIILVNHLGNHVIFTRRPIRLPGSQEIADLGKFLNLRPDTLVAVATSGNPRESELTVMGAGQIMFSGNSETQPFQNPRATGGVDSSQPLGRATITRPHAASDEPGENIVVHGTLSDDVDPSMDRSALESLRAKRVEFVCEITGDRPQDIELGSGGTWQSN